MGFGRALGVAAEVAAEVAGGALGVAKQGLGVATQAAQVQVGGKRVVVLGTGWGAARVCRDLRVGGAGFGLDVVSPRNHMVFTPLLPQAVTGTIDPHAVAVPIREVQPMLRDPANHYYTAEAVEVHPDERRVLCRGTAEGVGWSTSSCRGGNEFFLEYDRLVIATGAAGATFGVPGVEKYAHFLRDMKDGQGIRRRLLQNIEASTLPTLTQEERRRLLSIVIVGGGPTGVELAGELVDFAKEDIERLCLEAASLFSVTLVEAQKLVGGFDDSLRRYIERSLLKRHVGVLKGVVKEVKESAIVLTDGSEVPYGTLVWSTGVGPTKFISKLPLAKFRGRLSVDEHLNVRAAPAEGAGGKGGDGGSEAGEIYPDIFAIGDCAVNPTCPQGILPPLAQVAEQQGAYVAARINASNGAAYDPKGRGFRYKHLGSMASMGSVGSVASLGGLKPSDSHWNLRGLTAWFMWRSAYFTRLGAWRNRFSAALNWCTASILGRNLSRW